MPFSYHDTANESGKTLDLYEEKATDQESVILEGFKTKNPAIWGVLFAIASGLQFGFDGPLETLLTSIGMTVDLPSGFLSLDYILTHLNIVLGDRYTDWIMWILVGITGSKAAAFLPEKDREKALEKQDKVVERQKATDQESVILEFLRLHPGIGYTPFEILEKCFFWPHKPPITSVRRAITNLEHKHKDYPFGVRKSIIKRKGEFGRDNYTWHYVPELRQTKLFV